MTDEIKHAENTVQSNNDTESNTNSNIQGKTIIDNTEKMSPQTNEQTVTIKKSTYGNIIKGAVIAIAISTFLAGYLVGTFEDTDSYITSEDLNIALLKFVTSEELDRTLSEIEIQPSQISPQPTTQQPTPASPSQIIQVSLDDDPVRGNPDAPITIVEFSDFQCPFCSRFYVQTLPLIQENYIDTGKVKLVFRDLPLDSIHPNANPAHVAAQCANNQDKFWEYHDILFERQSQWGQLPRPELKTILMDFTLELGMDLEIFESCLNSPEPSQEVSKDYREGIEYGATGTPTFFIGTEEGGFKKLVGALPYSTFETELESILG